MSRQGPPPRRYAEDRDVVPPGRAVPEPRDPRRRRDHLPGRPGFDSHFLAALDLMKLPWGGLQAEAIGAWDDLAAQVARRTTAPSIISHEILATASRAQIGRALESLGHGDGHRGAPGPVGARPGPPDPRGVAGERQAPRAAELRRLPRPDPRPRARHPDRRVVLGRPGDPGHPRPLGPGPAARARAPGHRPAARRRARAAVEAVQPGLRPRRHRPRPRGRAAQPLAGRARDDAAAPDQPAGQRRARARPTTGRWSASCSPTRPCRGAPGHPGWRCRRTCTRGCRSCPASWIAEIQRRGYDVVGDLDDLVGAPPVTEYADPDHPRERQVAAAGVDAIKALLLDNARLRHEEERLHAELADVRGALERAYATPSYRLRRGDRACGWRAAGSGRGLLGVYRRARGRSSRSA